jgi:hypothetical protein
MCRMISSFSGLGILTANFLNKAGLVLSLAKMRELGCFSSMLKLWSALVRSEAGTWVSFMMEFKIWHGSSLAGEIVTSRYFFAFSS